MRWPSHRSPAVTSVVRDVGLLGDFNVERAWLMVGEASPGETPEIGWNRLAS